MLCVLLGTWLAPREFDWARLGEAHPLHREAPL
jgi:hypothetical protein